jgi:CDP-glucose 4,6-dehydratase
MFGDTYRGRKVLVTGNTGFKGSWLTIWLLHLGAEVYGISDGIPTTPSNFEVQGLAGRITHTEMDVRDADGMAAAVAGMRPDFVFHLAAQAIVSVSYGDPLGTISTNVMGTASVLDALRRSGRASTAVIITSDKCYDNVEWSWGYRETDRLGGKDPYSASKGAAELVVRAYHHSYFKSGDSQVKALSVRAGNVIGGGDWAADRIVPDCIRAWSDGRPVEVRSPEATRPWQHVLEPLSGYLRAGQLLEKNPALAGESYNFGPGADQLHTVLELLEAIGNDWAAGDRDKLFTIERNTAFHEAALLKLNCDKALHDLQWVPTLSFEQTSEFTASWYKEFSGGSCDMHAFTVAQIDRYVEAARERGAAWTR